MLQLSQLAGQELKWIQPKATRRDYELRAGDTVAGTLRFRTAFGSLATAETADGAWTFKRVGFWRTQVTIRAAGADTDLAVFRNNSWSGGGTLELPDKRRYLANTNFWATQFDFKTEAGEVLVSYKKVGGTFHMSSKVEIPGFGKELTDMPWLISLGWYLTVMMYADAAAAAVAAV